MPEPGQHLGLPEEIARAVSAQTVTDTTGVETGCGGIQYPLGGWLCPAELTTVAITLAQSRGLTAVSPRDCARVIATVVSSAGHSQPPSGY